MQAQTNQDGAPATEVIAPVAQATEPAANAAPPAVEAAVSTTDAVTTTDVSTAAETATTTAASVAETVAEVAEKVSGVSPQMTFFIGLGLLGLFVFYFAAETSRRKRNVGTLLAFALTATCVWLYGVFGMKEGIELQGGIAMEIKIQPGEGKELGPQAQEKAIQVLSKRLDDLGTSDMMIQSSGRDGIFLQMPGVGQERLQEITETLEQVAQLDFSILHPQSAFLAEAVMRGDEVVPGYKALPYAEEIGKDGEKLPTRYGLVKMNPDMRGEHVKSARYFYGDRGHSISVGFTAEGAKIMGPLTRANVNQPLAIEMDGVILSSPVINEPFADGCSITGTFTQSEALALASSLENPLENPIQIEYSNFISPTMGEATVNQGKIAAIGGLVITLVFLVIYYRFAGLLALIGLMLCLVVIAGTMALFQFTLTLPGIAGIILTIGVAIDANVLIYERLREEIDAGKSPAAAVPTAYERAFSAIFDANLTSLIISIILYFVAEGTVKGFAITVIIGIVASMFSALVVTRVCFQWALDFKLITKIKLMNMLPNKQFDFLGARKLWVMVSIIATVVSLIVLPVMDPLGVELSGGDSLTLPGESGLTMDSIKQSIANLNLASQPLVQSQRPVGSEAELYLIRSSDGTAEQILTQLRSDLGVALEGATISSVGSAVGQSMLNASIWAFVFGTLGIMVYIWVRFEFAFAIATLISMIHDVVVVLGIVTLLGQEFTLISVGAILTVLGYSVNDTIVIFDRVREDLTMQRGKIQDVMNAALNKTLSRTVLTGVTTLGSVFILYIFGGPDLRNFSLILIIGVLVGTYSSIFIASPAVLWWVKKTGTNLRRQVLDTEQAKVEALKVEGV